MSGIFLELGGPMRKISVAGKLYEFEMHPYCGPTLLNRKGEPCKYQPLAFLHAASLWAQQGQRIKDGLCRWDHDREPILVHLGGRHYKVVDFTEPKHGE